MKKLIKYPLVGVLILLSLCVFIVYNSLYGWVVLDSSGIEHHMVEESPSRALYNLMSNIPHGSSFYYTAHNSYGAQKITSYDTCFATDNFFSNSLGPVSVPKSIDSININSSIVKKSMLCAIGKDGQTFAISIKYFEYKFLLSEKISELFSGKTLRTLCVSDKKTPNQNKDYNIVTHTDGAVACE